MTKYGIEESATDGDEMKDCCLYVPLKKHLIEENVLFTFMCV